MKLKIRIEKRIEKLRESIKKENLDGIIIFSDENRRYLSGFTGEDGNYDESAGILIITDKDLILATDSRYKIQAENEAELYSVYCYEKGLSIEFSEIVKFVLDTTISSKTSNVSKASNFLKNSDNSCKPYDTYKIALETSRITFSLYKKIEEKIKQSSLKINFVPADDIFKNLRIIKDEQEIEDITESLKIAENSFLELKKQIHADMTEKEAAWLLEKLMREKGADSLSFPVIAASGPNSALPHAIPENRKFKKHEPILFDFGAKLNGYCSDISRTLIFGKPDKTFEDAYNILLNAQKMAVESISHGIKCSDIDKVAREYIDNSKFKGRFGHALGHGVGIAIHEAPRVSRLDDTVLQAGMVITIEPGIYIPDWGGIRLENMIAVTESGAEVLNTIGYDDYIINVS